MPPVRVAIGLGLLVAVTVVSMKSPASTAPPNPQGRVVMRRLNRVEYQNTIRDLLDVDVELKELLPADSAAHGFDNVGEALHLSSFQMERYLDAAAAALEVAIANTPQPPVLHKRYDLKEERQVKGTSERVFRFREDALVMFSSSPWQAVTLRQFYPVDRGRYRFRMPVSSVQSGGKPVSFRVVAGPMLMGTKNHLVGFFDAPVEQPAVVEFVEKLEARSTISILPYGLAAAMTVHKVGAEQYEGPGLAAQAVEVEGPLHDTWPPASHRRIFGDLPQAPAADRRGRLEVVSTDPGADATRILSRFAGRAFRRPVADAEVQPFVALVQAKRAEGRTFEQAVRVGLMAMLVAPEFLFLREPPGKLDDFALASRLSYFLWSSMPDEALLALAAQKKLGDPATLRAQVERMLRDPKAAAFTENFAGQWLGLRDIDFTTPDMRLYPEFDELLKEAMLQETRRFFDEVLQQDLSLMSFVDADFTFLNGRLAQHYGIPGVAGLAYRKVKLPPGSHRGGVMTMASVLKVTANGTTTSPVTRGVWVLDRILGTPPAPPPPGVPALEPDIRGATSIRDQLSRHRQVAACAGCHTQIDPPGFALESFDVIGGWRENYRTVGRGDAVTVDGRRMPYLKGPRVEPADRLPDGRQFRNSDELKRLLLADKDGIARALTGKLLTYATGAPAQGSEQAEVEGIVRRMRGKGYGFRALVHEVVQSKTFRYQ